MQETYQKVFSFVQRYSHYVVDELQYLVVLRNRHIPRVTKTVMNKALLRRLRTYRSRLFLTMKSSPSLKREQSSTTASYHFMSLLGRISYKLEGDTVIELSSFAFVKGCHQLISQGDEVDEFYGERFPLQHFRDKSILIL